MTSVEIELVKSYLELVCDCERVELKIKTGDEYHGIDILGINSRSKQLYICDLKHQQGGQSQISFAASRSILTQYICRFRHTRDYVEQHFSDYQCHYIICCLPSYQPHSFCSDEDEAFDEMVTLVKLEHDIDLRVIKGAEPFRCLQKLRSALARSKQRFNHPVLNFIQLEERLKQQSQPYARADNHALQSIAGIAAEPKPRLYVNSD